MWGASRSRCELAQRAVKNKHPTECAYNAVKRAVGAWKLLRSGHRPTKRLGAVCKFAPVTLYEICCSSNSATSRKVAGSGGAAVRVLWPPPYLPVNARDLGEDPPSRGMQKSLLPLLLDPAAGQRPQKWLLNMDWPVHRAVLMAKIKAAKPAPGTRKMVLLTSPQCRMFAIPQRLQHAQQRFDWNAHAIAMRRLRFMRRLHRAWLVRRRAAVIEGMAIHEQPPQASQDLLKKYVETDDFPWAISRDSLRRTVNGCMCGSTAATGHLIFKGWRFEVDSPLAAAALGGHQCNKSHHHAQTTMQRSDSTAAGRKQPRLRVSSLEKYPPYLGSLPTAAMSAR